MKLGKIYLLTEKQRAELFTEAYDDGIYEQKIYNAEVEEELEHAKEELKAVARKNRELKLRVEVLEHDRDDVREVAVQRLKNEDDVVMIKSKKDSLDRLEASLNLREAQLQGEENAKYESGYADGVADGLREAHKITSEDRENLTKVAVIAAASHGATADVLQLAEGNKNK